MAGYRQERWIGKHEGQERVARDVPAGHGHLFPAPLLFPAAWLIGASVPVVTQARDCLAVLSAADAVLDGTEAALRLRLTVMGCASVTAWARQNLANRRMP